MNHPGGRIWVDPEGVVRVGDAYGEQVELYQGYLAKLTDLRSRYANAWGDDDMGTEFSTKFLAGLDNLEKLIGGVKGTLEYTSKGLVGSGRLYRTVDDEAGEAGDRLSRDFESGLNLNRRLAPAQGEPESAALLPAETNLRPTEGQQFVRSLRPGAAETNLLPAGTPDETNLRPTETVMGQRRLYSPDGEGYVLPFEDGVPMEPSQGTLAFFGSRQEVIPGEPLEPLQESIRPIEPFEGTPMTSMHMSKVDFAGARINGEPLPEGYQLVGLVPLGDGTTRVDANRYESITPLGDGVVTAADGHPIDPGKTHLFVVKYDDTVDPTADGYEPLYLGFTADGTPIPLITDDE